jgi:chemotaxis protein histidine kinase CheA
VDQIKTQLDQLAELSDEQVAELQQSIVSTFESVESEQPTPETVDAMTSLADALDTVRAEVSRREAQAEELAARASEASARVNGTEEPAVDAPMPEPAPEESPVEESGETPEEEAKEHAPAADEAKKPMGVASNVTEKGSELSTEPIEETAPETVEAPEVEAPAVADAAVEEVVAEVPAADETVVASAEAEPEVEAPAETIEPEIAPEEQEEQAPVTAAAEESFQAPADRQPVIEAVETPVAITAGADIPGYTAGTELSGMDEVAVAMEKRLHSLRRVNGGDGEQHIVASFSTAYPDNRVLSANVGDTSSKIKDLMSNLTALTASGGFGGSLQTKYDVFGMGSTNARPVRDALPKFQADRGGIRFITPPRIDGVDYFKAVDVWSETADKYTTGVTTTLSTSTAISGSKGAYVITLPSGNKIPVGVQVTFSAVGTATTLSNVVARVTATTDTSITIDSQATISGTPSSGNVTSLAVKGYMTAAAAAEDTAVIDAVTLQIQFGNLATRAYPELISLHNELALVQHAREAEQNLLSKISAKSTWVNAHAASTEAFTALGAARDFLVLARKAAVAYRSRHRLEKTAPLTAIVPSWLMDAMVADLIASTPGDDKVGVSLSEVRGYFNDLNIDIVESLDLNPFPAQAGTVGSGTTDKMAAFADVGYTNAFQWYLFAAGTFLFLDGGSLDLGIIRDSGLVNTNDYRMFIETFEGIAKVGIESLRINTLINVSGTSAALTTAVTSN